MSFNVILFIIIIVLSIIGGALKKDIEEKEKQISVLRRQGELIKKYGEEIGIKVFNRKMWTGMTEEQLIDSWGNPDDLKNGSKRKTYYYNTKYGPRGGITSQTSITIKDGIVSDWRE